MPVASILLVILTDLVMELVGFELLKKLQSKHLFVVSWWLFFMLKHTEKCAFMFVYILMEKYNAVRKGQGNFFWLFFKQIYSNFCLHNLHFDMYTSYFLDFFFYYSFPSISLHSTILVWLKLEIIC